MLRDGDLEVSGRTLDEVKAAWARGYEGLSQEEIDRRVRGFATLVRGIAKTGTVTPDEFCRQTGSSADEASQLFSGLAASGMEVDESGNIVGAALTTTPTPHALSFGGRSLFAWCALDTLFIPGLLDEVAEVESTCPASGTDVRLVVTPEGVSTVDPGDAALSVVLPGVGASGSEIGLASPT